MWVVPALLALAATAVAIDPSDELEDPQQQALYEDLTDEVRCLVCQNQTIADSTAPLAADLRREIRRMIEEGKSEDEIKDFLVERYGGFVLYTPRFQSWNIALWLAPAALLAVGLFAVSRFARNRADLPIDEDAE
ncbi:MAG: cytochrome c-type biogenesis protein CcmH [Gammaproteobacteria bacterium]|nr:cytochrome c-type biogenesis protein CcmH [Gammaproteobacteria bacterium]